VKKGVEFTCLFLLGEFGRGKSTAGVFGCDIKLFVDSDMFEQKKRLFEQGCLCPRKPT
jgi:hypothetical protein